MHGILRPYLLLIVISRQPRSDGVLLLDPRPELASRGLTSVRPFTESQAQETHELSHPALHTNAQALPVAANCGVWRMSGALLVPLLMHIPLSHSPLCTSVL